jgi:predicted AlkP superfamily pyrophosphatase or phosphodiesterase
VGFGLADLSQSIFTAMGLEGSSNPLQLGDSDRTCLLLIDGLGAQLIAQYANDLPVLSSLISHANLDSHFPSTTATNLASLGTGELPGVHGMLGYTVRVPRSGEPGRLLNALKWDDRVDPLHWQKIPTLFERATAQGISVSNIAAKRYEASGFTQAALRGAKYLGANQIVDMVSETKRALKDPRSFAYVYMNQVDEAGHSDGVGSEKWLNALSVVCDLITRLIAELPQGTKIYITADHGMINVGKKIILGVENDLMENVTLVGGEPRARHIYISPGAENEVAARWAETLGTGVDIYLKEEAITQGLFGMDVSAESIDRMGDLIAVAQGDLVLLDPDRAAKEGAMVGHHGGLTENERLIPLLSYQT